MPEEPRVVVPRGFAFGGAPIRRTLRGSVSSWHNRAGLPWAGGVLAKPFETVGTRAFPPRGSSLDVRCLCMAFDASPVEICAYVRLPVRWARSNAVEAVTAYMPASFDQFSTYRARHLTPPS